MQNLCYSIGGNVKIAFKAGSTPFLIYWERSFAIYLAFFIEFCYYYFALRQNLGITKGIKASRRGAILETLPPWGGVSLYININHPSPLLVKEGIKTSPPL